MPATSKKGIYDRRRLSKMASRHCCKGHKSTYSTDHERIFLLILLFLYWLWLWTSSSGKFKRQFQVTNSRGNVQIEQE